VETLAWQDIQDPQILQWKKTIAAKYQDAIYATIEAYDIAPNTNGIPTGSLNMQTGPFKNNAVAWRPVYAAIGTRNITLPDGSTYTWPDADPTKAKKFIGEARIIKDGVTTADGTTVIAGFRQNAFLLSELLLHEYTHLELFSEAEWNDWETRRDREGEVLDRVAKAFKTLPRGNSQKEVREWQQLDNTLKEKRSLFDRSKPPLYEELWRRIFKRAEPFDSAYSDSVPTSVEGFSIPKDQLARIRRKAGDLEHGIAADYNHRRLAEQEQRRREEQARVERDDFQFAIYWIFNECRGTPSLPIQGNFARLLANRPDARKTLRRLASFKYVKAENAALSNCVDLLIRSLPDYPNADRVVIDRNWARRVQREELERRTYHPPAKQTPSATPLMKPSPRIPFPSQPRSPTPQPSPAPSQPAPEPERPYMKPCINGRCLNLD